MYESADETSNGEEAIIEDSGPISLNVFEQIRGHTYGKILFVKSKKVWVHSIPQNSVDTVQLSDEFWRKHVAQTNGKLDFKNAEWLREISSIVVEEFKTHPGKFINPFCELLLRRKHFSKPGTKRGPKVEHKLLASVYCAHHKICPMTARLTIDRNNLCKIEWQNTEIKHDLTEHATAPTVEN